MSEERLLIGDLRVWHVPQVPGNPYFVKVESFAEAEKVLDVLAYYDIFQFENRIKPDFSNAQGVERYEEDGEGGYEWYEIDLEEDEPWEI